MHLNRWVSNIGNSITAGRVTRRLPEAKDNFQQLMPDVEENLFLAITIKAWKFQLWLDIIFIQKKYK